MRHKLKDSDQNAKKQRVMASRSKKRMQGEDGDPYERKKQRIRARVRFSLPTQKCRAMDDECDVGCDKRRKFATSAESGGEMEDLQWMEHAKRMFRLEMLAEATHQECKRDQLSSSSHSSGGQERQGDYHFTFTDHRSRGHEREGDELPSFYYPRVDTSANHRRY
ncbi:unnamed protein product [Aphanomyces euteiches]